MWPWEWLLESNQNVSQTGVMFCDHSINVCTWELRYENPDVSSVWLVQQDCRIASSLEKFFEKYLADPWLFLPEEE